MSEFALHGMHHVQIAVPAGREAETRAFYGGLLNLREVPVAPGLGHPGTIWYEQENLRLHLGVEADFHPARKAHPAFLLSGLDALIARLEAAGVKISRPGAMAGFQRCHIHDPFGNRIELIEPS